MTEEGQTSNGTVKLSSGVVLRTKQIHPMLIDYTLRANMPPMPKMPKVYIENKGREEENPADPEYIQAMADYNALRGELAYDIMLGMGTEIADAPKGFQMPKDTGWSDDLEAVGIKVPESGLKRYIFWAKFVALLTGQDIADALEAVRERIATPEAKVAEAADSFRNRAERRADPKRADKPRR